MKRGEIWLINLDPTVDSEIRKTRPAVIVNADQLGRLPLKIIVPITDWKDRYSIAPWMVTILPDKKNGLSKESSADCFQIRSVAEERCVKRLGLVDIDIMDKIRKAIGTVLNII